MRIPICRRGERATSMHRVKVRGSQGQPKREDLVLIRHPLECESQELSVMGGYLDMKVSVFQIQWHEPVPWAYLREDLLQCDHPERPFYQGVIQESVQLQLKRKKIKIPIQHLRRSTSGISKGNQILLLSTMNVKPGILTICCKSFKLNKCIQNVRFHDTLLFHDCPPNNWYSWCCSATVHCALLSVLLGWQQV